MVDEQQEPVEDEGEYHFSDDQLNYESETAPPEKNAPFSKEFFLEKFNQHRRRILGMASIVILVTIVYKVLVPSSQSVSTDIKPVAATVASKPADIGTAMPVASLTAVTKQPMAENVRQASAGFSPQQATSDGASPQAPSRPSSAPFVPQMTMAQPSGASQTQGGQVMQRLAALEQQNTAMMSTLHTDYAQKIADVESQGRRVGGQLEALTTRVNRMEAGLNKIMQLLQQGMNGTAAATSMGNAPVAAKPFHPKMAYSVQAIIPGRAWLKSDAGDTVTVAEGEYLKGYGRVTKIDPYDGVVAIDTGDNRVITLSYGSGE